MNLADAIRRAAQSSGRLDSANDVFIQETQTDDPEDFVYPRARDKKPEPKPEVSEPPVAAKPEPKPAETKPAAAPSPVPSAPKAEADMATLALRNGELLPAAETFQTQIGSANAVRLELFLAPEQISTLMKSVVATQHSVMTVREAAQLLRIPATHLKTLAENGEVPGFKVDGSWRFARVALESWLADETAQRAS